MLGWCIKRFSVRKELTFGKMSSKEFAENLDPVFAKVKVLAFLKKLLGISIVKTENAQDIQHSGVSASRRFRI